MWIPLRRRGLVFQSKGSTREDTGVPTAALSASGERLRSRGGVPAQEPTGDPAL